MANLSEAILLPLGLVMVSLMMGIGMITNGQVFQIIDDNRPGMSAEFNDTADDLMANTWQGYNLGSLLPIVFGASAVISVVISAFLVFR